MGNAASESSEEPSWLADTQYLTEENLHNSVFIEEACAEEEEDHRGVVQEKVAKLSEGECSQGPAEVAPCQSTKTPASCADHTLRDDHQTSEFLAGEAGCPSDEKLSPSKPESVTSPRDCVPCTEGDLNLPSTTP